MCMEDIRIGRETSYTTKRFLTTAGNVGVFDLILPPDPLRVGFQLLMMQGDGLVFWADSGNENLFWQTSVYDRRRYESVQTLGRLIQGPFYFLHQTPGLWINVVDLTLRKE